MADIRPIQPVSTPNRPRLTTPPAVRIAQPSLSRPSTGQQFVISEPKGPRDVFDNKGFFGDLLSIPGSALKAVGTGIAALPTLGGKLAQTAVGFGEGAMDLALDAIDEDIYTSRFETDLEKGRELGLEGDALASYAAQRQYPFGSMIVDSLMATGRRGAELLTAGRYDYGAPGIDYAEAFREGDLGALLIEDIGNIVLAGRAGGLGNVVARGGAQVAKAGAPRLGRAIETTGRFTEEPVATTLRGTARTIAPRIDANGRISRLADPLERIGQAETPLRQATNEIRLAYQQFNLRRIDELTRQINIATDRQRAAQDAGDIETAQSFAAEVNTLREKRTNALGGGGLLGKGRQIVRRGKIAEERAVQNVISLLRRMSNMGALPETAAVMRKKAAKLRESANKQADEVRAEAQQAEADALDFDANMKEQYPEVFEGKPQPWMEEAAIHIDSGKARELARLEQEGMSMAEIVAAATDPYVDPAIADRGMLPTEDGVRAAIEFVKAMDAQPSLLNPGELHAIQKMFGLLREYGALIDDMMMRGFGLPEGPAPFYWRQPYPIPQNLLLALDTRHRGVAEAVVAELNQNTLVFLNEMVRQGVLDQDFFDTYNIDPNNPDLFRDLVAAGIQELQAGSRQPLPYMVAYNALKLSYNRLRRLAPNLMLDLDIYPAIMRPAIGVRRQAIRQITGEEVLGLAEQLADLARDHGDVINPAIVKAITKDIRKALDPRTRIENATFNRLLNRINTIRTSAANKLKELRTKEEGLTTEERILDTRLIELEQSLGAMEATVRTLAAQQPETSARLVGARQRVADAETETQALLAEQQQIRDEIGAAREAQSAMLRPLVDRLSAEETRLDENLAQERQVRDRLGELERRNQEIDRELSLLPAALENPAAVQADFELVVELQGAADTAADAQALRAERIQEAETEVQLMQDEMDRYFPTGDKLLRRGNRVDPRTGKRMDDFTLAQEDVQAALWPLGAKDSRIYRAFYREFTDQGPTVETADGLAQIAETAWTGTEEFAGPAAGKSVDQFLEAAAKQFVKLYEARQRLKEARKSAERYRGEVLERDLLTDPVTGEQLGQSGLTSQQVIRALELQDPVALNALLDERKTVARDIDRTRTELDNLARERARIAADAGVARGAIPEQADLSSARLTEIGARLTQLRNDQRNALRSLRNAEKAEPKEAAREQARTERAQLRGVGRIRRPEMAPQATRRRTEQINQRLGQLQNELERQTADKEMASNYHRSLVDEQGIPRNTVEFDVALSQYQPTIDLYDETIASIQKQINDLTQERNNLQKDKEQRPPEGPALGELTIGARNYADASAAQLNKQQERNVARLRQVRRNIAEQDRLEQAATIPEPAEAARLRTEVPLGPELLAPGELPGYLPAGPPRSFFPGDKFEYGIRGEGAAPQTRLQATQQRVSGAFVLTLDGMAARLAEVIGQQYRNSVIEEILRDPDITKSVASLLGEDVVNRLLEEAEIATDQQNIPRNTTEFNQAVQRKFGSDVIEQLRRRGYEVATPVRVDPETFAHSPVGDLTIQARPNVIDGNTLVMRQGVRERIVAEYERKGVREVPAVLRIPLEKAGNLTARWKSHILPLSLRWQIGDAVGIVMFAWLRGDIPPKQLIARIREAVGRMTDPTDPRLGAIFFSDVLGLPMTDPALAALFGSGLQARGLKIEENQFIERLASRLTGVRSDVGRFKRYDTFRAKAFRVNEAINSLGRAAVALENLDRILSEQGRSLDEITGPNSINDPVITKAINDAVDATNTTLGAFSDLNPWEKQVMRQVFPFWSWIKFINKAAYELTIDNPDRVLFYAHLGSMAADPDDSGLADWLRGKTPVMGTLVDLSFMNPYADAILISGNPLADATETFTSISPAIETPRKILSEIVYAQTGREYPFLQPVSRPGYLEGRPEASTRTLGDVLGGAAYLGIRGLVPIARNIFDILPTGTIPGTDIATGPVQRFGQGSLRTTGAYAEPRLSPLTGRLGGLLRTFGIPAPLISQETARRQAAEQQQRDEAARLRRIVERQRAGG